MYRHVLKRDLGNLGFKLATKQRQLPTVLHPEEVTLLLSGLRGVHRTIFELLYGSGLRITECLRLRVKDIDLKGLSLTVRDGKGKKDRQTILSPNRGTTGIINRESYRASVARQCYWCWPFDASRSRTQIPKCVQGASVDVYFSFNHSVPSPTFWRTLCDKKTPPRRGQRSNCVVDHDR